MRGTDTGIDRFAATAGLVVATATGVLGVVAWLTGSSEEDLPLVAWLAFWAGLAAGVFALGLIIRHFIAYRQGAGLVWVVAALGLGGLVGGVTLIFQTDQLLQDFDTGFRSAVSASSGGTIMLGLALALASIGLLRDIGTQLPQSTPSPPVTA